ncbi:MAG: beta-propeller domain-containing protein [Crenarchaeota archaeon]|nr:beta-propeller domain-containing protein [Thermoproteota archaeon]MDW8034673.1 beta-propeller domain-containing protein [Nitrososphaerota archaeon]
MKKMFTVVLSLILILSIPLFALTISLSSNSSRLRRFSSHGELENFVKVKIIEKYLNDYWLKSPYVSSRSLAEAYVIGSSNEYSTTNIQVSGVDEADSVKTDGRYIYMVSGDAVLIIEAYPPEKMKKVSEIRVDGNPIGLFINDDRLAVLKYGSITSSDEYYPWLTVLEVYDISNVSNPVLKRRMSIDGFYLSSRMIGNYIYIVATSPVIRIINEDLKVSIPKIIVGNNTVEIPLDKIFYSDTTEVPESYTTIVAIDLYSEEGVEYKSILTGYASCMYVSVDNIYIVMPKRLWIWGDEESAEIHRIRINGLNIKCEASGEVPGRVLNQFSMDEYEGYFRIATTTGRVTRFLNKDMSANHVYILDSETLRIVGRLEGLAPGEQIYSARFMGSRCYLVTFKKVDPLFTIDLSNPAEPRVLGKLKIPGYSDYLHPYDDNYLIGVGKETVEAEEGDFAWYQGLKISLFDVSNVTSPREVDKMIIGDRGTESPVLRDHHAFLFDRKRNLLVIPILEARIFREKYSGKIPPYVYGEYVFQGAYVFSISPVEGISLRGRITHLENTEELEKSGYYFSSKYQVVRSLYIGNVLYTLSSGMVKANSLTDLSEISRVILG